MRFHGRGRIVKCVGILRRFPLQLALIGERAGAAIAQETIVPDELDVVTRVTRFDAVDADGIAISRVARPTAVEIVHRKRRI